MELWVSALAAILTEAGLPDGVLNLVTTSHAGTVMEPLIRDGRATKGLYPPKTNWSQKLDTPPYTAYAATCGLTFTYGGLKINPDCQVLNKSDRPIPGLYAAGELTAGFFYYNYPSGSGLLRGAVTGKIAGTNAASQ